MTHGIIFHDEAVTPEDIARIKSRRTPAHAVLRVLEDGTKLGTFGRGHFIKTPWRKDGWLSKALGEAE